MLDKCSTQWASNKPILAQRTVFAGILIYDIPLKGYVLMLARRLRRRPTLKQHWVNDSCLLGKAIPLPANMRHRLKVVLLLGQRRRRWANSKTTLSRRLMFAELLRLLVVSRRCEKYNIILSKLLKVVLLLRNDGLG